MPTNEATKKADRLVPPLRAPLVVGPVPELDGDALAASRYRAGHMQIIASAGSGKTEVVAQRVANLLIDGERADSIIAFTFTERAAASLKTRIERRVAAKLGADHLDKLNGMFVGTIHGYCFSLLQQHVPRYANYDVLDDHRLTAWLTRDGYAMGVMKLGRGLFASIKAFSMNLQVIENELIRPEQLEEPLKDVYEHYLRTLDDNRFLTYGQMIAAAVRALDDPVIFARVHDPLRHLVVDEYQDVNPAQEALIKRLGKAPVHVCVVADDDQSIYQWRGSDVQHVLKFKQRYRGATSFQIGTNRRSRPQIIAAANHFVKTIEGRLPKAMTAHRPASGAVEAVFWTAPTELAEVAAIADGVVRAHRKGYRYRDIAILCRGRVSFTELLAALADRKVPVQPGGRTNLFLQPDAAVFGRTIAWLVDRDWRTSAYGPADEPVTLAGLMKQYKASYTLTPPMAKAAKSYLEAWKARAHDEKKPANLIKEYYGLLRMLGVHRWPMTDALLVNRMGTLARCSRVIVDYETTRRRARMDADEPGKIHSGQDRGLRYYTWFSSYIGNWAMGAYEDFEGEDDVELDAVDLTTIHKAKGLEWPIVFVPSLTDRGRFPSNRTGQSRDWLVPTGLFDRKRYEGSVNDERRLFYVAVTRAREFVSLSAHERINRTTAISPFLGHIAKGRLAGPDALADFPAPDLMTPESSVLEMSFSDLSLYDRCGLAYRMRRLLGFEAPLAPEIGYGKAVHHVLRRVAEFVAASGRVPNADEVAGLFDSDFYMPAATREAYRRMKAQGRRLVDRYLTEWQDELHRVWASERPFELHFGDATIAGRADVIIDEGEDGKQRLSIVDYKTATQEEAAHDFQLQVYTDAGRREGLIVEGAFVHDLKQASRTAVPTRPADIERVEGQVRTLLTGVRARSFAAKPNSGCIRCDVRELCQYRSS